VNANRVVVYEDARERTKPTLSFNLADVIHVRAASTVDLQHCDEQECARSFQVLYTADKEGEKEKYAIGAAQEFFMAASAEDCSLWMKELLDRRDALKKAKAAPAAEGQSFRQFTGKAAQAN